MNANRAVIFVNGVLEDLQSAAGLLRADDWLVAVDGGLRHLRALGRAPHVLIGDLDSVDADGIAWVEAHGGRVLRYPPEKDDTDLELALVLARTEGYSTIRLIGALGGRVDHLLGNLGLLAQPALAGLDVRMVQPGSQIFLIRERAEIEGRAGDLVSLLPLFGVASSVRTKGLQYPLRGESLLPYRTRGISNVMLGERATVSLEAGMLLCVHTNIHS
jgi:thiamine pyrophosphokinase